MNKQLRHAEVTDLGLDILRVEIIDLNKWVLARPRRSIGDSMIGATPELGASLLERGSDSPSDKSTRARQPDALRHAD
jgi:hypothetical protein